MKQWVSRFLWSTMCIAIGFLLFLWISTCQP